MRIYYCALTNYWNDLKGRSDRNKYKQFHDRKVVFEAKGSLERDSMPNPFSKMNPEHKREKEVLIPVDCIALDPVFPVIWQKFDKWLRQGYFKVLQNANRFVKKCNIQTTPTKFQ